MPKIRRSYFGLLSLPLLAALLLLFPGANLSAGQAGSFILLSAGKDGLIGTPDDVYAAGNGNVARGSVDLAALRVAPESLIPSSGGRPALASAPGSVALRADRPGAPADGRTAVTVTAEVKDIAGRPVPDGTVVAFSTTLGSLSAASARTLGGAASVRLVSSAPGEAVVTASAGGASSSISVSFRPAAVLADDFSADSGLWAYGGSAYRDPANGYVALTRPGTNQVGYIWLRRSVSVPFAAEFKYRIGGGTGADGIVFMFYKNANYAPYRGGWLGFTDQSGFVPGYGVELDTYYNSEWNDPGAGHVALVKDRASNHLQAKALPQIRDNNWHRVKVVAGEASVEVYFDGAKVLSWEGSLARDFGGMGFAAATGGAYDWHVIDDFRLEFFE